MVKMHISIVKIDRIKPVLAQPFFLILYCFKENINPTSPSIIEMGVNRESTILIMEIMAEAKPKSFLSLLSFLSMKNNRIFILKILAFPGIKKDFQQGKYCLLFLFL